MIRFVISLLLTLWATQMPVWAEPTLQLSQDERLFLAQHPQIVVSNEMDWPPFDFAIDSKPMGYSIDLLDLIGKKLGVSFTYVNGHNWDELWKMFEEGKIDITHPVGYTQDRERFGRYSDKFYSGKLVYITRHDVAEIKAIDELKGRVIAISKGFADAAYLKQHYPNFRYVEYNNTDECIAAVKEGRADVTIGQDAIIYYLFKKEMETIVKVNAIFHEYNKKKNNDLFLWCAKIGR